MAGWTFLLVVVVAWIGLGLRAHFDCGGGLGLFGEDPDADFDRACHARALRLVHLVWLFPAALVALRIVVHRRSR